MLADEFNGYLCKEKLSSRVYKILYRHLEIFFGQAGHVLQVGKKPGEGFGRLSQPIIGNLFESNAFERSKSVCKISPTFW